MQTFVRGADIKFSATFVDASGSNLVPTAATLRITYLIETTPTTVTFGMTDGGGGVWFYYWQSGVSYPGVIQWFIDATGGLSTAVAQGQFALVANIANPNPV